MITDILLEEALSIMATDHWVWKLQILDDGLKLSLVLLGDLATEDDGNLLGLADGTIGIQQSLAVELVRLAGERSGCHNIQLERRRAGADTPLLCARFL